MECSRWRRARGLGLTDCWDGPTWNGSLEGGMIPFQIPDGDESHPSDGLEGTAKGVVWVVGGWRPRTCGLESSRSWRWIRTDRPSGREGILLLVSGRIQSKGIWKHIMIGSGRPSQHRRGYFRTIKDCADLVTMSVHPSQIKKAKNLNLRMSSII